MPSVLGHSILGVSSAQIFSIPKKHALSVLVISIICSVFPDVDVLGYKYGVLYDSLWGHRGFTHSLVFSFLLPSLFTLFFLKKNTPLHITLKIFIIFLVSSVSHSILDAFTNGGLGVAFFSPFSEERIFFDYQPIQVSSFRVSDFLTARGLSVIKSEIIFILLPTVLILVIISIIKKITKRYERKTAEKVKNRL